MLALVRENDTVARLGGDEFTLVLGDLEDGGDAGRVARKLLETFRQPFAVDGRTVSVTASIGIALFPWDGTDVDTLLCNADAALYQAKDHGRDTVRFYAEDLTARLLADGALEAALRQALAKQEFVLYYQPQLDLASGRVVGAEALVRWRHPARGLLEPAGFLPLAESTGLIVPLSAWVMRTAAVQWKAWRDQGLLTDAAVWVNLSQRDLQNPTLAEEIADSVGAAGLEATGLGVEIGDAWIAAHPQAALANLRDLQRRGIAVGLDDFGTGSSSLVSLQGLPLGELKVDRTCIAGLPDDRGACAIAAAAMALGQAMDLRVVAEGIETQVQADFLAAAGCRVGQGDLFSRPLPAAEFAIYARGGSPLASPTDVGQSH
jgi:predicted signal transduction protein with EAL and GGDEF domain